MGDSADQVLKQKKQQTIITGQEKYDRQQQRAWQMVDNYKQGSGAVLSKQGRKHMDLDEKSLFDLKEDLYLDSYSKSESFTRMYDAVNNLLTLSAAGGRFFDEDGNGASADFFAVFFEAKQAVAHYLDTHDGFKFRGNSKRRYQIALRVDRLLNNLGKEIVKMKKQLSEENLRKVDGAMQDLSPEEIEIKEKEEQKEKAAKEMKMVLETGQYGPEMDAKKEKKARDKWLEGGYSEHLKTMIEGRDFTNKEEKNDFYAYLEDANNKLWANKMTISLLVENNSKELLGIKELKDDLTKFIYSKYKEEDFNLLPEKSAEKIKGYIKEYLTHNKAELDIMKKRKKILEKDPVLGSSMNGEDLFDIPAMKELMLADEEEFKLLRDDIKEHAAKFDTRLNEMIAERFSQLNREGIKKKLDENLGALRLFGSEEQVFDQAGMFFDMFRFIAPDEYKQEHDLERAMKKLKIEEVRREDFVNFVKQQKTEANAEKDVSWWVKQGEVYAKHVKENTKSYLKRVNKEGLALTMDQWQELEELNLESGSWENRAFKATVEAIMNEKPKKGRKQYSRREFISKRDFDDAAKMPARIKRAKLEKDNIKKLGNTMDKKLLVLLSGDGSDPNEAYRKLDDAYKGNVKLRKAFLETNKALAQMRASNLSHLLQKSGIPKKEWNKYTKKFDHIMQEMRDVDDEMHEDVRLQNERYNLENFGVKSWNELMNRIESYGSSLKDVLEGSEIAEARKQYEKSLNVIEKYDDGKYKAIAGILTNIPELYGVMMNEDEKTLTEFLKNRLAPKMNDLMAGLGKAGYIPEAIFKQYVYSYAQDIFSGALKADADQFAQRIKDYKNKVYSIRPDGMNSIADNIRDAKKELNKLLKARGMKDADIQSMSAAVMGSIEYMANSTEDFALLMDREKLTAYAKKKLDETNKNIKKGKKEAEKKAQKIYEGMERKFNESLPSPDPDKELRAGIQEKRRKGRVARMAYLGIDDKRIDKVRLGGSLVRVGENGRELVTLNQKTVNKMREMVDKYAGSVELPQVLKDALIEEGASADSGEKLLGIYDDYDLLFAHAAKMETLYKFLREDSPNDGAMSDEEAQMFIVNIYGDPKMRPFFDSKKSIDLKKIREGEAYKIFRGNYAKLKQLESVKYEEDSMKRQQLEISRNLRTMLITNVGYKDNKGKSINYGKLTAAKKLECMKSLGEMIDKQAQYMEQENKLTSLVRIHVMAYYDGEGMSDSFLERQVQALREYFIEDLTKDIKEGKEFNEESWDNAITAFYSEARNRKNLEFGNNYISKKTLEKEEQRRMDSTAGEKNIADAIKASVVVFHGRENRYEKLDADQKKLFAIGLMLMDKGAVGMGSTGTAGLLSPESMKKDQAKEISEKINEYVKGGKLSVNIDYKEAFFKLVNYGDAGILGLTDNATLSVTAYEKAMHFVRAVTAKKEAYGEKDVKRITDGYSSIYAAFVNEGKTQQNEIDKLQGIPLSMEEVRDRLIQYAENDRISKKTLLIKGTVAAVGTIGFAAGALAQSEAEKYAKKESDKTGKTVTVDKKTTGTNSSIAIAGGMPAVLVASKFEDDITTNIRLSGIQKRLKDMKEEDLKLFIRLLQERSVMDTTTGAGKDDGKFADEDGREALKDALAGDVQKEVLEGFDDSESCHQAMATALSFQLKDHLNFSGKPLTKEYFDKDSLDRNTLVDWLLIEKTFDLMDEIKAKRNQAYAIKNATKYIRLSGNQKAIDAHAELEKNYKDNKESFTAAKFERLLGTKVNNEAPADIKEAFAGFQALSQKDKNLFFKVLARRDLLDMSKKNMAKSYITKEERKFINAADRNKLIDEYIEAGLEDNIGVQLDKTAYYDAMESLYSTQVSDDTDFARIKNMEKMFAGERLLFMNRNTAVDWKLFRRALNFVTRAKKELSMREGNALLYRGAGDLSAHGQMVMDYSFLRRNFHKTGNRWNRYLGTKALQEIKEATGADKYLETVINDLNTVDVITDTFGMNKNGYVKKGIKFLKKSANTAKGYSKKINENPSPYNIEAVEIKEKEKTEEEKEKEKKKEEQRRENLHYYEHMKEGIDNIIALKKSSMDAMSEVTNFIKDNFASRFVNQKYLNTVKGKEANADKENLVEKTIGKSSKGKQEYGDSRDYITKYKEYKKKITNGYDIANTIPGTKELLGLIRYGAEMLTYRLINNKIVNADVKEDENELANLKKEAEKYYKDIIDNVAISVMGKERAKVLLDGETGLYNIKDNITKMTKSISGYVKYAKKCVSNIQGIADSIENKQVLATGKKFAADKREEDTKKLKETGGRRLNERQLKKAKDQNEENRAIVELGNEMVDTLQSFNIAENTINLAINTVNMAGGKLNVTAKVVSKAVKAGLEFAMFAMRVATDRKALTDYFLGTEPGRQEVNRLKRGFLKTGQFKTEQKFSDAQERYKMNIKDSFASDMVDIIANANGYESTAELVEDTAMNIAQSMVFCASDYNPMAETRLMAMTVMVVMGLEKEVGNTSPETVEKLFKSFKMTT